jgi:ribonuclease VapC
VITAVVDTSALFAILFKEPERPAFHRALMRMLPLVSAPTKVEFVCVAGRRFGPKGFQGARALLEEYRAEIVAWDDELAETALDAFANFGKGRGRSPAALNFGDLFSYGLAKARDLPLLYKGKDFGRTDVVSALDVLAREEEQ